MWGSRWLETTPRGVSWLGFFYGGNIAGAVAGSILAGFYLLRVYDSDHAIPRNEFIRESLAWLDRYLGPVEPASAETKD